MSDLTPAGNEQELDQWIKDQLRARGLDPDKLSVQEMIALMQEAVQTIVVNLSSAAAQAGDISAQPEIDALLEQAKQLRDDLARLHDEMDKRDQAG